MSLAKLSHNQHNQINFNVASNANTVPSGLLTSSLSLPNSSSNSSLASSLSKNLIKSENKHIKQEQMPQMPTNLHNQFLPRNLPGQIPNQGNPLNEFSAAYAAAAAAASAGYPPFGHPQSDALAMFSQFNQNGSDPRNFPNNMGPNANPLAAAQAAAAYAQYCNDPMAASMLSNGGYPYSPQSSNHLNSNSNLNGVPSAAYQNLMLGNLPGGNIQPGSQLPSNHNSEQTGNGSTRRKNATRETTATLKAWLYEHRKNPYPTKGEKIMLAIITKMSLNQVSTWFANARRRLKKENKMTFSPRNRTAEDIDSDDEQSSKSKNGKKNGSTSSDNMNFDDLDDLDDINDEELEDADDEENDEDSFSYNSDTKSTKNHHHQGPLSNNNNMQNLQKPPSSGAHHHGHHPYFNGQQLQLQQQQQQQLHQQQQQQQYFQSLFPPGTIDANKMMSMMLNSSGAFNPANSPLSNSQENKNSPAHLINAKNNQSPFMPPSLTTNKTNSSTHIATPNNGNNKSSKPKIWSLADVATNNSVNSQNNSASAPSKQQKSLNNSLSSLSSSSLSSSSSNSSTNYYAPVSPALKTSTALSQPLNINASNALTPNSTAPLSSSSSSHQNQSPKSTSSSANSESNNNALLAQQHQQFLSLIAAAAAQASAPGSLSSTSPSSASSSASNDSAASNFHQLYLQQLTSQLQSNPFNNNLLTQSFLQQASALAKQQNLSKSESEKDLDATTATDLNSDEENQTSSLENTSDINKSQYDEENVNNSSHNTSKSEKNETENEELLSARSRLDSKEKVDEIIEAESSSVKHKLENDDDDEESIGESSAKRQKIDKKSLINNKISRKISRDEESDNEDEAKKFKSSDSNNEHKATRVKNASQQSSGLLIQHQQQSNSTKPNSKRPLE